MQRFDFGLHVPVDDLREWVVSGIAHPVPELTPESERQFALARQSAAQLATIYVQAGFAVAIDDVIDPENAAKLEQSPSGPVHKVLLRPTLEVTQRRNAERKNKPYTSVLQSVIISIYEAHDLEAYEAMDWFVLDSSVSSVSGTVDAILAHFRLN